MINPYTSSRASLFGRVTLPWRLENPGLPGKLMLSALIITLIPLIALGTVSFSFLHGTMVREANETLGNAAAQTAFVVDGFIRANPDAVRTESQLSAFGEFLDRLSRPSDAESTAIARAQVTALLSALCRREPVYMESYALLDANGVTVAGTQPDTPGGKQPVPDYISEPLKTGLPYVSPVQFAPETNHASLYFGAPVRNSRQEIVGALVIRYNAGILQQMISAVNGLGGKESFAVLVDENLLRLADGSNPELVFKTIVPLASRLPHNSAGILSTNLPAFEQSLSAATLPFSRAQLQDGPNAAENAVVVKALNLKPWSVAFAQPEDVFLEPITLQVLGSLLLGVLIVVLTVLIVASGTRRLTGPILRLTTVAERVSAGDLNAQARVETHDEIGMLAKTFNPMTRQLRQTMGELETRGDAPGQANDTLGAAKARLQHLLKTSASVICCFEPRDSFAMTFISENVETQLGYKPAEFTVDPLFWKAHIHPDDIAQAGQLCELFELGEVTREYRFLHKDNSYRWLRSDLRLIRNADDSPQEIVGAWIDISERKRAELALQQTTEKYRSLIDSMDSVISIVTPDGQFVYLNEYGARRLGMSPEQVVGKNVLELLPGSLAMRLMEHIDAVVTNDKGFVTEQAVPLRDKSYWVRLGFQPIHDADGKTVQVSVISEDITDIKQAQQLLLETNYSLEQRVAERTAELEAANRTLHASKEKFRVIAETIDEVFWIADPEEERIAYVSPGYLRVWGTPEQNIDVDLSRFLKVIHPDDLERVMAEMSKQVEGKPFAHEYRIVRPDGSIRWLWDRGFPVARSPNQAPLYVGIAQDITDRKQAELELEQSLREKDALLKEVHHRVKNNLQVISSLLSLQLDASAETDLVAFVQNSQSRIESMALIHEKLYRSTDLTRVDFRDYIDDLTTSLYSIYRPKGGVSLEKCVPEVYFGIDTAIPLGLIVNELMANAFKYAFRNGNGHANWIQLSLYAQPDGAYVLTIGDNGVGLPEGLDYRKTTSLGLQLVMTLVAQLDGTIELFREHGTEYRITFHEVKYKPR